MLNDATHPLLIRGEDHCNKRNVVCSSKNKLDILQVKAHNVGSILILEKQKADAMTRAELHDFSPETPSRWSVNIWNESPVAFLLLDGHGLIHEANPTAARLFQSTPEDVRQNPCISLF